ncbi:MAG: UDP-N-acetylglucosamine diphosphorylase [Simkaniaceae bacterium]|nr:UDP-N-acetylglucosamine diphosphorylase [Candidatus Sacchlamyda saccharinae]
MEKFYLNQFFDLDGYALKELFKDCRFPWEALARIESFLEKAQLGMIQCPIPEGVTLVNPEKISIGKGTVVEPGAFIRGPCIIGENCQIRHGAYIRGNVITGSDCIIGHATELKSSILLDGACCAHFNYVGDSFLGNRVNLGAGVKLANLRLDNQLIQISDGAEKIPTNLKKLGAILGDGVQIGCNAVLNPATVMGREALCYPCLAIGGVIPPHAKVRSTKQTVVQDHVDRSCF